MEKIIADFGVQPIYLAAQAVNFLILVIVLNKFLFKPLLNVLEQRKQKVAESLDNAEQIKLKLSEAESEAEEKVAHASRQAKTLLENAANRADRIIADAHEKAHADAEHIINKGKASVEAEREAMQKEVQQEFAKLLVLGIEKVSGKVLNEGDHTKIVDETIEGLKINS